MRLCRCAASSVAPLKVRLAVVPVRLTLTVSPLVAVTTELPLVSATLGAVEAEDLAGAVR